jgi:predicted GNAT family acetyltransferase
MELRTRIALQRCVADGCVQAGDLNKKIVAVAMAQQPKREHDPSWGEIGWVAVAPEHRGRGLGTAVCAGATRALLAAGLEPMLVVSHDNLPAIKTYLKVGYAPVLRPRDIAAWTEISRKLVFRLEGVRP